MDNTSNLGEIERQLASVALSVGIPTEKFHKKNQTKHIRAFGIYCNGLEAIFYQRTTTTITNKISKIMDILF